MAISNVEQLTLPAPAKLNLFLHITGRRDDGYHNLQTLFQILDFGDELTFTRRADKQIKITPEISGVALEDNLIYKAARLLQSETGSALGVDIHLLKKLPMGGGIGGGSSDAATTLLALNSLWDCQQSIHQLAELGRQLGADVPVFVNGVSAWAEGIGEQLQPIELPEKYYVVLTPDCEVSTAKIFGHKDLTRDTPNITVAAFLEQGGRNDCQPLVCSLYPQVADLLNWLNQHGEAKMTGTGASVFAAFDSQQKAREVLAEMPESVSGFVARGVNVSPAHKQLF